MDEELREELYNIRVKIRYLTMAVRGASNKEELKEYRKELTKSKKDKDKVILKLRKLKSEELGGKIK